MEQYKIQLTNNETRYLCNSFKGFDVLWEDLLEQYLGGTKHDESIEGFLVRYTGNETEEWDGDPIRVKIHEKFGDGKEHYISMDWFVKLMETIYCIKLEEV